MSSESLAALLGHLGRADGPEGARGGLTQAQWAALRYMARANALSRTVSALAAYQATTRGTVSQTVKALVAQGYLTRNRSQRDGRSIQFDLTPAGEAKLREDPGDPLAAAVARMSARQRQALADAATELAGVLVRDGGPCFGTCRSCQHCVDGGQGPFYCCSAECALGTQDLDALCVAYTPQRASAAAGERS